MATDARSQVTIDVAVNTAQVPPKIAEVKSALRDLNETQKEINETAKNVSAAVPRSTAEQQASLLKAGILKPLPPDMPDFREFFKQSTWAILDEGKKSAEGVVGHWQWAGGRISEIAASIKSGLGGALQGAVEIAKKIGGVIGTWGAFGVGFGISALFDNAIKGMDELVKTVDQLQPVAKTLGVSVQELQRLTMWAKQSGTPVKTVTRSLEDLGKNIGSIHEGLKGPGVKRVGEAFAALGFTEDEVANIKNVYDVIPELATRLSALDDPLKASGIAAGLFSTGWRDMLPLMLQGPEAFQKAIEASQRAGEIAPNLEDAAGKWKETTEEFYASLKALRMEMGGVLIESLAPVLTELVSLVQDNREVIVSGFKLMGEGVKFFANALVDTLRVVKEIKEGDVFGALQALISPRKADVGPLPEQTWKTMLHDVIGVDEFKQLGSAIGGGFKYIGQEAAYWFGEGFKLVLEKIKEVLRSIPEINLIISGIDKLTSWLGMKQPAAPTPAVGPTAVSTGGGPIPLADLMGARNGPILGQAANGEVKVTIENKNPPPGTRTSATATGPGVTADVGQSMPWSVPQYSGGPWAPGA